MLQFKKVGIASDHAGKELKQVLVTALSSMPALELEDFGVANQQANSVDYPDYAAKIAQALSQGQLDGGIAICGTGLGMAITANKFPRVRAVSAWDELSTRMGREHNDSNVVCLGARCLSPEEALKLVRLWLATPFTGERHQRRIDKITAIEKNQLA